MVWAFFSPRQFTYKSSTGIEEWFDLLLSNYNKWTSIEHLQKHQPSKIFLLDETEYLTDIIVTINKQHIGE